MFKTNQLHLFVADNAVKEESFSEYINTIVRKTNTNIFFRDTHETSMTAMKSVFIKEYESQADKMKMFGIISLAE
jgi:hypothetical protein